MKKGIENSMTIEETEEKEANVVSFQPRLITGGKGTGVNWLMELPIDTVFLIKNIAKNQPISFALNEFHKIFQTDRSVKLMTNMDGPETYLWVDPVAFCNQFRLVEILHNPDE